MKIVKASDTGDVWECPFCHKQYHLIHRGLYEKQKEVKQLKHDFEEIPNCHQQLPLGETKE